MDGPIRQHYRPAEDLDHLTIQPHPANQEDSGTNGQKGPAIKRAARQSTRSNQNQTQAQSQPVDRGLESGSLSELFTELRQPRVGVVPIFE